MSYPAVWRVFLQAHNAVCQLNYHVLYVPEVWCQSWADWVWVHYHKASACAHTISTLLSDNTTTYMQVSYSSLQGIALLLMLGYTMYDLVFDAKLGIIARTLYRAMPDLAHYSVMAMLLVTGITMASHITLGPMLPAFDTFSGDFLLLLPKCSCCQCVT